MTRHGKEAVVVSVEQYRRLAGQPSLLEFIRQAPDLDLLELERAHARGRAITL